MASFGDLCESVNWDRNRRRFLAETESLHGELCTRLATSTREALSLPLGLPDHAGLCDIIRLHADSLVALDRLSMTSGASGFTSRSQGDRYGDALLQGMENIIGGHAGVISSTMMGMYAAASELGCDYFVVQPQIDAFLERFFLNHIGMRFRLSHHSRLWRAAEPKFVGALALDCQPQEVAKLAARESRAACIGQLGQAPAIIVQDTAEQLGGPPLTCTHWPAALRYVLREVFKNSCRAVVERHADGFDDDLPPIHCAVGSGPDGLTLRILDEGGGIPERELDKVWRFMYTTCDQKAGLDGTPLAGYGVGLAMSRLYLRYLGGDLSIDSRPGRGTEVCLHLRDVQSRFELLPGGYPQEVPI